MNDAAINVEKKNKSFLRRLVGWSVKWVFFIALAIVIFGLRDKQEKRFISEVKAESLHNCGEEQQCLELINTHFDECIKYNYTSHKSGKFGRKYELDSDGYSSCLQSFAPN